jgi:hypothetical protein
MNFDVKPFDFVHNIALLSSAAQPPPNINTTLLRGGNGAQKSLAPS